MQDSKKLVLPLMIVVALAAGCGKKEETTGGGKTASQVAAKVNGTEVTVDQVNFALQRIPNLDKDKAKEASLQVVRSLVDQELLLQKAEADKLDRDPKVVQALDAAHRQILAEAYLAHKLGAPAEPSDAEVSGYFDKHPELFTKRKIYRLQEITIKAPQDKQEEIRAQLHASKNLNDFAAWLKSQNIEAHAAQGVKPAEQLPLAMVAKLAEMPDGQVMVVNAPAGLTVILLADSQMQPVTLEQAKPAIVRLLQAEARKKAAKAELDSLRAAAKIEYVGEFAAAGKETAAPAEPAAETKPTEAAPNGDASTISKGSSGLK